MTPATMPMPEGAENGEMTMTIVGEGVDEFGQFYFWEPGYYKYEIFEVDDAQEGYTYDKHVYTVEYFITVSKEDNSLVKEVKVDKVVVDEFKADQFTFVNTYAPDIPDTSDGTEPRTWSTIMFASMACAMMAVLPSKKRKKEEGR